MQNKQKMHYVPVCISKERKWKRGKKERNNKRLTIDLGVLLRQLAIEGAAEHAQDLAALVVDDGVELLVEQDGDGEAARVVRLHGEVQVPEVCVLLVAGERVRHHVLARRVVVRGRWEGPSCVGSPAWLILCSSFSFVCSCSRFLCLSYYATTTCFSKTAFSRKVGKIGDRGGVRDKVKGEEGRGRIHTLLAHMPMHNRKRDEILKALQLPRNEGPVCLARRFKLVCTRTHTHTHTHARCAATADKQAYHPQTTNT